MLLFSEKKANFVIPLQNSSNQSVWLWKQKLWVVISNLMLDCSPLSVQNCMFLFFVFFPPWQLMEPFYFTFQHKTNSEALTGVHQVTSASTVGRCLRCCRVFFKTGVKPRCELLCLYETITVQTRHVIGMDGCGHGAAVLRGLCYCGEWMGTHSKHTHPCDSSWCLCLVTGLSDVQGVLPSDGHAQSHVQMHVGPADGFMPGPTRLQQEA